MRARDPGGQVALSRAPLVHAGAAGGSRVSFARDAPALARIRAEYKIESVQVEYTMLAPYAGDVLVEHDVTFALHRQIRDRRPARRGAGIIGAGSDSKRNGFVATEESW